MGLPILTTTSTFGKEDPGPLRLLEEAGLSVTQNPHKRKLTQDEVLALLKEHRAVGMVAGVEPLTAAVLEAAASDLKVISRCGTGMESVDLDAAERLGIKVYNTPDSPSQAVAELAIGLALAVLRKIAAADRSIRAGKWSREMGSLLGDKVFGVVGYGRIGRRVAKIAEGFGCRVLAYDSAGVAGADATSLDELVSEADIVSLHLPLVEETRNLFDAKRLRAMKPGAILINASRGGLVDEAALAAALDAGLGGAGLDVFEEEPYSGPLKGRNDVVLTAHMGSAAKECRVLMEREAAENLIKGLKAAGVL